MRRRGFTLVEIIVALGLFAALGGTVITLMARSEQVGRSSEASEAASLLAREIVRSMVEGIPPWMPQQLGQSVDLTPAQIEGLLQQGNASFRNPNLYTARITWEKEETPQRIYNVRVCVHSADQSPICHSNQVRTTSGNARYVPGGDEGAVYSPAPGRGYVLLRIIGPSGGQAQVSFAGQNLTAYGHYPFTLPPGDYQGQANTASDSRYTYEPSTSTFRVRLNVGEAKETSVTYTCATGAAAIEVVPPEGYAPPSGTVLLGATDVSQGGVVPYLPPGGYVLQAKTIRVGPYSYNPQYAPGQNVTVSACQTASATVSYRPATGALKVVLAVPDEAQGQASVSVSGPSLSPPARITDTQTLENLTPGTYNVSPQDALVNGVRYRGTASPATPQVAPGSTATSQVSFAPVSGRLQVSVAGPSGAPSPSVSVAGPSLNETIGAYGTRTYDDLTPGTYQISAKAIQDSLYTYHVSPAVVSVTLGAGDRISRDLVYRATTGAARITVRGLPSGASPGAVKFAGTPLSSTDQTFPYLSPGRYTVEAAEVSQGGYVYAPSSPSQTVDVTEGRLSQAEVAYTRLEGTVSISVSGLPSGVQGSWKLTGPGGERTGTGSQTLTGMPTGTYSLTANEITAGGITYRPTVSPGSGTLQTGGSLSFAVSYGAVTGNLQVNLTGLPSGASAGVRVSGPGGYSATVNASTTLSGLTPGEYVLQADPVSVMESTPYGTLTFQYRPNTAELRVQVSAGSTASGSFSYTKQSGTLKLAVTNPSGSQVEVTLSGPGGFQQTLRTTGGTFTYSSVPTGTYSAEGKEVTAGGMTYRAAPVSGTLNAGGTLNLNLAYQAATGRLSVSVSLPAGAQTPTVVLEQGGKEVGRFTGTNYTFDNLLPGDYRVAPLDTSDGTGFSYKASAVTVSVQAGATASASLLYVKQSAFLRFNVSGLPSGTAAPLELTGPGGTTTLSVSGASTIEVRLGDYGVKPGGVTQGGYTYTGTASPSSVSADTPGSVYTIDVAYTENSGTVVLKVSGLPSGVQASLGLLGPTNLSQSCGNGNCTFTRVPAGTYSVSAPDVTAGDYTYRTSPSPSSVSVSSGGSNEVQVAYAPVDGALSVSVEGPSGMPTPTVVVKNSSGQTIATRSGLVSFTLSRLSPGTYSVDPQEVTATDGTRYTASAASASVTAGQTASVTVRYVAQVGTLTVSVSGLPSGCTATLTLSGTATRSLSLVNGNNQFTLPSGSYSASVSSSSCSGEVYKATPSSFTFTLSTGSNSSQTVQFTPSRGSLVLRVSGLPSGAAASFTVSKDGRSTSHSLGNGTHTIPDLPVGDYTITASSYVQDACIQYAPTPASRTATVADGSSVTASFSFSKNNTCLLTLVVSKVHPANEGEWPTTPPPTHYLTENGTNWRDITAVQTYTFDLTAGKQYDTSLSNGYEVEIGASCLWRVCWERRSWLLEKVGFPITAGSGAVSASVTWRAKKCKQEGFAWNCYVWKGSSWGNP